MGSYICCSTTSSESRQVEKLASFLKIISEPSRLRLLCLLRKGEHCVCELMQHTGLSQSLISHHLKDLRETKIVSDEKHGTRVYYSLTDEGKRVTELLFRIS